MFTDFDRYLNSAFSDDYWSDEGIGFATGKIKEFSEADWEQLKKEYVKRDTNWLVQCAETLGDVDDTRALELLMKFLNNEDTEVQVASLDSINSLLSTGLEANGFINELRRVATHMDSSSEIVNMVLGSLQKKIC